MTDRGLVSRQLPSVRGGREKERALARTVERIEFTPDAAEAVVARMDDLARARDGWINLLPGVPEADVTDAPRQTALSGLFGPRLPDVTMVTFMPPKAGRRGHDRETLGLLHPIGKRALPLLREAGVVLPSGWQVRQDHVRRGMVLEVAAGTPHGPVLEWALAAGTALCIERMTGSWRADVHLPTTTP